MDNIIFKWLYLLKSNNELLKIKLENSLENNLLTVFEEYFINSNSWVKTLKDYSLLLLHNLDDDTQKKFYKLQSDVPFFWEIKTNIINWTFNQLNTISNFEDIKDTIITSWVIHIEWYQWNDKKDVILFQSFNKASMYVAKSFWDSKISMWFTWRNWIFKNLNEQKILNLKKIIDVVHLDDWKVYVLDSKKYDIIFNFPAELKKHIWTIFRDNFLSLTSIFEFDNTQMTDLIQSIQENYYIAKKVYIIHKRWILNWLNLITLKNHLNNEWIMWLINSNTWKIIIQKAWFDNLLDALNHNLYTSWNWDKFKAKAKTKR